MSEVGHAARLVGLLRLALPELEEAVAALVDNVRRHRTAAAAEQEQLFEEGGRLAVVVHLRAETFRALAKEAVERLSRVSSPPPRLLAELVDTERDYHLRLGEGEDAVTASVLAASGDARTAPERDVGRGVDLTEALRLLESWFYCVAGSGRSSPGSSP